MYGPLAARRFLGEQLESRQMLSAISFVQNSIADIDDTDCCLFQQLPAVLANDIDLDGDIDVVWSARGEIHWSENTDGGGTFGAPRSVDSDANDGVLFAADFDGDGDIDLLNGANNRIVWYENADGRGAFGEERIVAESGASSFWPEDRTAMEIPTSS